VCVSKGVKSVCVCACVQKLVSEEFVVCVCVCV
jgi:hypothetical protein